MKPPKLHLLDNDSRAKAVNRAPFSAPPCFFSSLRRSFLLYSTAIGYTIYVSIGRMLLCPKHTGKRRHSHMKYMKLGDLLVDAGVITDEQLGAALKSQKES